MTSVLIENPVLNSPFHEPGRHFRTTADGEVTGEILESRRASESFVPVAKPKKSSAQLTIDAFGPPTSQQPNERGMRTTPWIRNVGTRYLRELSATWRKADGGTGRRMLAEALFSRIEVLGGREATIQLTDAAVAHGFAAVIPDRLDVTVGYGRGERI